MEDTEESRKRKREPSVAPSTGDVPSPGGEDAFRSGQGPEALSQSTAPLDLAALPTARISKLPTFAPAPNGSKFFLTPDVPGNRPTFRYTPAGAAEPGRLVLHRSIENAPAYVRFSWEDRSPHIRISQDAKTIEGYGGFRSARVNVPVREGKWYVEFMIEKAEDSDAQNLGKHVRLGWARREASLNGPVGLDGYSYGLRDVNGHTVTLSRLRPYGRPFKQGDVVGLYISLPPKREPNPDDPYDPARMLRKRIPIGLKLQPYFEMAEYPVSKEMKALLEEEEKVALPATGGKKRKSETRPAKSVRPTEQGPVRALPILKGSRIAYFINGQCQGVAFTDIYDYLQLRETPKRKAARERQSLNLKERHNPFDDGTLGYYPMVSLFHDAIVSLNAGPDFAFPPPPDIDSLLDGGDGQANERTWKPLCERYEQFVTEMFALDELEEQMAREKLLNKGPEDVIDEKKAAEREKRRKRDEARRKAKKEAEAAAKLAKRTETPPRGGSTSMRAQSSTPQPPSSRPGSTPNLASGTPAFQSDATPPPGESNAPLSGAQRRRQKAEWESMVMNLDKHAMQSRDPSTTRDESSGRSSPAVGVVKSEEAASPAIRSPAHSQMKMEVDE